MGKISHHGKICRGCSVFVKVFTPFPFLRLSPTDQLGHPCGITQRDKFHFPWGHHEPFLNTGDIPEVLEAGHEVFSAHGSTWHKNQAKTRKILPSLMHMDVFFHLGTERVHLPSSTPQHFSRPSRPRLPSPLVLFIICSALSFSSFSLFFSEIYFIFLFARLSRSTRTWGKTFFQFFGHCGCLKWETRQSQRRKAYYGQPSWKKMNHPNR